MDSLPTSKNHSNATSIHIMETVRALRAQGHQVHHFLYGDAVRKTESTLRQTAQRIGQENPLLRAIQPLLRDVYGLYRNTQDKRFLDLIFRDNSIDLVYERLAHNKTTVSAYAQRYKIPLIVESNEPAEYRCEYWGAPLFFLMKRIENTILERADAVMVVSTPLKKYHARMGIDARKIHVMHNGVNEARFSPESASLDVRTELGFADKVIIGFVGTAFAYHGIELFSRLAQSCQSSGDDLHFMIVGGDQVYGQEINQLRSTLDQEQLSNMFTFTGPIANTEVPNYIAAMDICILPRTLWFGSPMKILEYAAMGKAIVAPDQENIRDVLTHGETAILVEPGKPVESVQAVQELVTDEQLRIQLGNAAREHILSRHTWTKNAERILEIYQQINL